MKQPRFDRADRASKGRGNTLERLVHEEAQIDDFIMFAWQRFNAGPDDRSLLARFGCLVWQRSAIGLTGELAAQLSSSARFEKREAERPGAKAVPMAIEENRAQPGEPLASPIIASQALPGLGQDAGRPVRRL